MAKLVEFAVAGGKAPAIRHYSALHSDVRLVTVRQSTRICHNTMQSRICPWIARHTNSVTSSQMALIFTVRSVLLLLPSDHPGHARVDGCPGLNRGPLPGKEVVDLSQQSTAPAVSSVRTGPGAGPGTEQLRQAGTVVPSERRQGCTLAEHRMEDPPPPPKTDPSGRRSSASDLSNETRPVYLLLPSSTACSTTPRRDTTPRTPLQR